LKTSGINHQAALFEIR